MKQSVLQACALSATFLYTSFLCMPTLAENKDEHRQHDSHEHGHAALNLVQENQTVQLMFESPAVNIVGFEYMPKNTEQHRKVTDAIERLKQGETLFVFSKEAQCIQTSVEVETALSEMTEHKEEHHDEYEEEHHDEHDAEHDDENEGHSEFVASYQFECQRPDALKSLTVKLFEYFPQTEEIDSQLVTGKRQFGAELSPGNTFIKF